MNITSKPTQCGFTLLEILISLLILSVGLLGLAGLQLNGLRNNQGSYYLSQAMAQAYDMADRMRANMVGVTAGDYDAISPTSSTNPVTDPGCITTGCTSAQIEQYDVYQWSTANSQLLPGGNGSVTNVGGVRTITVMWDQLRNGATGTACSGNPAVDLTCFQTSFQP